jgi:hypothetical protein
MAPVPAGPSPGEDDASRRRDRSPSCSRYLPQFSRLDNPFGSISGASEEVSIPRILSRSNPNSDSHPTALPDFRVPWSSAERVRRVQMGQGLKRFARGPPVDEPNFAVGLNKPEMSQYLMQTSTYK